MVTSNGIMTDQNWGFRAIMFRVSKRVKKKFGFGAKERGRIAPHSPA
jgi:hypothetical protein